MFFVKGFKKNTKLLVMQTHLVLKCYYNNSPQRPPPNKSNKAGKGLATKAQPMLEQND